MNLFDDGWNKLRETIFANQKRLGIMPENAKLTPWPKELPQWDSLSWDEKKLFVKQADVAMSWPGHINEVGGVRRQFHHIIDIVPTILEATGIPAPQTVDGIKQHPIEGVSMMYTWDKANANAPTRHTTQYFEMLGNRAIYHDGWLAATTPVTLPWELNTAPPPDVITGYKWELYNVQEDPTEFNDLAAKMPEKVKQMQTLFYSEAKKYGVLPLDNSTLARWNTPRPSLTAGRTDLLFGRTERRAGRRCPEHPEQVLLHHCRG